MVFFGGRISNFISVYFALKYYFKNVKYLPDVGPGHFSFSRYLMSSYLLCFSEKYFQNGSGLSRQNLSLQLGEVRKKAIGPFNYFFQISKRLSKE